MPGTNGFFSHLWLKIKKQKEREREEERKREKLFDIWMHYHIFMVRPSVTLDEELSK